MRMTPRTLTIVALLALAACTGDPTTAAEHPAGPHFEIASMDGNCAFGGDFGTAPWVTYTNTECSLADTGFTGVTADFAYSDSAALGVADAKRVIFTHEVRWTASGSGYRLADAAFAPNHTRASLSLGIRLLKELEGAGMEGFAGSCPTSISNAMDCAEYADAHDRHDEPRLCIWNSTVGAGGNAATFCDTKMPGNSEGYGVSGNLLPVAQFSSSLLSTTNDTATWRFDASASTDSESSSLSYEWELSDGTTVASTSDSVLDHAFAAGGTYSVRLRVTDGDGGLDVQQRSIVVALNQAPVAAFNFSCSTLSCSFTDQSSDADGTIASRHWSFGDGASSTAQNPGHTYSASGTYNATLAVTDDDGAADSITKAVTVSSSPPLSVEIQGPTLIGANKSCTWDAMVDGGNGSYSYLWERDGSTVSTGSSYTGNTGTSDFDLSVTVTSGGQQASSSVTVGIIGAPLGC